jgi:hypothetical protein
MPLSGKKLTKKFCSCIKKVRTKIKPIQGAIGICIKSVLQTKGKTLKKFKCRNNKLYTQPIKN